MSSRRSALVVSVAMLLFTSVASANTPSIETFRCELTEFVGGLRAIPSVAVAPDAAEKIAALAPAELDTMQTALTALPNWQQLPAVVASLDAASTAHDRMLVGRLIERGGLLAPGIESARMTDEEFRTDLLFLIDQMGRFGPVMDAEFTSRVDRLRATISRVPAGKLGLLRDRYYAQAAEWQAKITSPPPLFAMEKARLVAVSNACDSDCGDIEIDCWIELAGCAIGEIGNLLDQIAGYVTSIANFIVNFFDTTIPNLISQIGALGTQAITWFTNVFNQVSTFVTAKFNEIKNALPQDVNQVLNWVLSKTGIDLNNINWGQIASSIPTIAPPCPSGNALTVIGAVCDSGANALTGLLYEVAPDDGLSLAFKLGLAVVHFPLSYLCQCVDIKKAHDFDDAQAAHRAHTSTNLNDRLGTRATQVSVNSLNADLNDVDSDVAKAEAKLDALEATAARLNTNADRIEQTTNRTRATVNRIETNVNRTEATTDRTEDKVDALTSGNNTQHLFLTDFSTLMQRLNIEQNLLENKPDVISLFQLPSAFGGKLETVSGIVADTIRITLLANQAISGAEREMQRGNALRLAGDFVKAYEAYRSAYREAVK